MAEQKLREEQRQRRNQVNYYLHGLVEIIQETKGTNVLWGGVGRAEYKHGT